MGQTVHKIKINCKKNLTPKTINSNQKWNENEKWFFISINKIDINIHKSISKLYANNNIFLKMKKTIKANKLQYANVGIDMLTLDIVARFQLWYTLN